MCCCSICCNQFNLNAALGSEPLSVHSVFDSYSRRDGLGKYFVLIVGFFVLFCFVLFLH